MLVDPIKREQRYQFAYIPKGSLGICNLENSVRFKPLVNTKVKKKKLVQEPHTIIQDISCTCIQCIIVH